MIKHTIYNAITCEKVEEHYNRAKAELALRWIDEHESRCERDGYRPNGKNVYIIVED